MGCPWLQSRLLRTLLPGGGRGWQCERPWGEQRLAALAEAVEGPWGTRPPRTLLNKWFGSALRGEGSLGQAGREAQ